MAHGKLNLSLDVLRLDKCLHLFFNRPSAKWFFLLGDSWNKFKSKDDRNGAQHPEDRGKSAKGNMCIEVNLG